MQVPQPQPYPKNYKPEILSKLDDQLIDGESVRVKWDTEPFQMGKGPHRRYFIKFRVNAKNRLGGYVGWQPYSADFVNGRVQYVQNNPYSALIKPN
jgi:hypothetical protein